MGSRTASAGARISRALLAVLALGCGATQSTAARHAEVTFNEHIAPILLASCSSCHRPGTFAPFALLSYDDVKPRAALIAQATRARRMPPWLPRSEPGEFVGQRSLSQAQIDLIARWAATGAPRGDAASAPELPEFVEDWQLGQPDRVARMPVAYALKASGPDVFRNVVVPVTVERTRYVKGIELLPGNPRVLHHASITVDRTDVSRRLDDQDREVGFDGMMGGDSKPPDGHFLGWTPGKTPRFLPDGTTRRLIDIPRWNFHWQDDYRYTTPMALPAGTRLTMEYGYDNSAGNPHNPSSPPKPVVYGPRSSDEMGDLWIQVLPRQPGDLMALRQAFARKEVPALIAGYEQRLRMVPGDWNGHNAVAVLYLALGDIESARQHLTQALRLDPRFDRAHNNLAALHERENRHVDAIHHYELAVTHNPRNYKAQTNLANAYLRANRPQDASRHYRSAIAANAGYAPAHRNLARLLTLQGNDDEARTHRRIAEALRTR